MIRRTWARLIFGIATAGTALVAAGFLLQFTLRDRVPGLSILFYMTPWPVLAVSGGVLAAYWQRHGRRALAGGLAVGAIAALACWLALDWEWRWPSPARGALRVVLWNVDRPYRRLAGDANWLRAQDADFIAIAERQPRKKDITNTWQIAFPGYELAFLKGEMLCLVRGELVSLEEGLLEDGSFGALIRVRVRGREVTVLQVDILGNPPASRRVPLHRVAEIAGQYRGEPLLVVGDFNSPRHSAHLAPLRGEAANAFEAVGSGCSATWPMPVPVLSLDQMWTNARLRPVRCAHAISWRSDHRAVVAEFDFVP